MTSWVTSMLRCSRWVVHATFVCVGVAPQAHRAMIALAVDYFVAGAIVGA